MDPDLLRHEHDFPLEMRGQVRCAAVRTKQCDRVHAIAARALVADEVAQKVFTPGSGLRREPFLHVHPHRDEAATWHVAIEIAGRVPQEIGDIALRCPGDVLLDRLDIYRIDEIFVGGHVAAIRADGLSGSGEAAKTRRICFGPLIRRTAQLEHRRTAAGRRTSVVHFAIGCLRQRYAELHLVAGAPNPIFLNELLICGRS